MFPSHEDPSIGTAQRKLNLYRKHIRREGLQKYFGARRLEMINGQNDNDKKNIINVMTTEKKQQFLRCIVLALSSEPCAEWREVIKHLKQAASIFYQDYDSWLDLGIIDKLASLLHTDYIFLQLQQQTIGLFSLMVRLNPIKRSRPNAHFMSLSVVQNIVLLMRNLHIPLIGWGQFLYFFGIIGSTHFNIRNYLIQKGAGELLKEYGEGLLKQQLINEQYFYNYLGYCEMFLKIFKKQYRIMLPDTSFTMSITPNIVHILTFRHFSQKTKKLALDCIDLILRHKKQTVFNKLMSNDFFILQILLLFIRQQSWDLKLKSLHILNLSITFCQNFSIVNRLFDRNFMGIIEYAINHQKASVFFKQMAVNTFTQLICAPNSASAFVHHSIFDTIVSYLKSQMALLKQQSYYCISSIFDDLPSFQIQTIFSKYGLLHTLITQLQKFYHATPSTNLSTIQIIKTYIMMNRSHDFDYNRAVDLLQRVYDFSKIVNSILWQCKDDEVIIKANQLADIIGDCVSL